MSDKKLGDEIVDTLDMQMQMQGTGVIQVKDGHVFLFNRKTLQTLLDKNPGEKIVIFIKHTPKA